MPDKEGCTLMDFADDMYAQLDANMDKGGWEGCTAQYLLERLFENMDAGRVGIENGASTKYITEKFANVANYAMMIQDNYTREHTPTGEYRKRTVKGEWID